VTTAVRPVLLGLGVILLVRAIRMLIATPASPRIGSVVPRCAVRLAGRTDVLRRRSDPDLLALRLALAPRTWPARAVATAARDCAVDLSEAMAGVRLLSAVCVAGSAACVCIPLGLTATLAGLALGGVAGAAIPDTVLARAARRSARTGRREMARTIDVLAAAVSANHALHDALELTAAHAPPAVAASLRRAAVRLATGVDPATALATEADRSNLLVLADVGAAADRQRRLGIPLGPELCQIAARHRAHARADVLTHAARRAPLGTLVVALVIAPVCIAALTACLVGGLIESGGLAAHV
jgi:hypothetical protein